MTNSDYELPLEKNVVYALASLCVATYVSGGIRITGPPPPRTIGQKFLYVMGKIGKRTWRAAKFVPSKVIGLFRKPTPPDKIVSDRITADTPSQILAKFQKPFAKLGWKIPPVGDIWPIRHNYHEADEARLGAFAIATDDYIAVAFRGTAYSEEWVANISYGVPAVQSLRQVLGVTTLSLLPILKKSKQVQKMFGLKQAQQMNAGYLGHLKNMVADTKKFLDSVRNAEQADSRLTSRPLYFTGHSLGGAAAIITSRRVLEDEKRDYKRWFASRMKTVTFGAPPISAIPVVANPDDPPIYNLIRPGDIVPSVSIDVLGIPLLNKVALQLPGTPYHWGNHYFISDNGKRISMQRYVYKRGKVFRSTGAQFLLGIAKLRAFRHTMGCHYMANYAKDLECLVFPADCRKWHG